MNNHPTLFGRRVYVCDQTGRTFISYNEVLEYILNNAVSDELVVTSYCYGALCKRNLILVGQQPQVDVKDIEYTPGSADPTNYAIGMLVGGFDLCTE